jgi:hypothetical protein
MPDAELTGIVAGYTCGIEGSVQIGVDPEEFEKFIKKTGLAKTYFYKYTTTAGLMIDFRMKYDLIFKNTIDSLIGEKCLINVKPKFYKFTTHGKSIYGYNFYINDIKKI